MCWQVRSGIFFTTLVGLCMAYPFAYPSIPAFQQQRQFYFAPLPAASNPSVAQFPFASPPSSNYVYFAPQPQQQQLQQIQPQRLVSPAPSALRYPAPTTAVAAGNGQYVVVYPGGTVGAVPGGSVVYVGRQGEGEGEGEGTGGGWPDFFNQLGEYFSWPFSPSAPAPGTPGIEAPEGAEAAAAPAPAVPAKPEKVESAENKPEVGKLQDNAIFAPQPQRFVVVGQPQFFGHFAALQKANPIAADDPVVSADGPGSAALAYQRLLVLSKKQQQQQKETAEAVSVTVDAKDTQSNSSGESSTTAPSSNEESENVDAENEEGPSIAQAKPQAISLAGPGGVAAAAPVGTALVGPGGMALSAPSATAVAGPTAGAPISIAPANKAAKTYFLAKQNPQYLFQYKP